MNFARVTVTDIQDRHAQPVYVTAGRLQRAYRPGLEFAHTRPWDCPLVRTGIAGELFERYKATLCTGIWVYGRQFPAKRVIIFSWFNV